MADAESRAKQKLGLRLRTLRRRCSPDSRQHYDSASVSNGPATFSDNLPTWNAFQPNYRAACREISSLRPCLPDLRELCYSTQ